MKHIIAAGSAGKNIATPLASQGYEVLYLNREANEECSLTREEQEKIKEIASEANEIAIIFGGGGKTGTTLALAAVELLKEHADKLKVYLTLPLAFEGKARSTQASETVDALRVAGLDTEGGQVKLVSLTELSTKAEESAIMGDLLSKADGIIRDSITSANN